MIVVPIVAYGNDFVHRAQFCLASLRAEGNLPDVESKVIVFTDQPEMFQGYECRPPVNTVQRKHKITSQCYKDALALGHPIAPIAADMICSKGLLASIEKHSKDGKKLVLAPVPRVNEDTFIPALPKECIDIKLRAHRTARLRTISIAPRELARLAIEHLHEGQREEMFWDKLPSNAQPTTIFRKHGDGLVANCFHRHPVLFHPPDDWEVHGGIDGNGVEQISDELTHVITDSDEGLVVDLCAPEYNWNGVWAKSEVELYRWAQRNTNDKHRRTFQHDCYIHPGELIRATPDPEIESLKAEMLNLRNHLW